jgi:tetratricopeptide (TPR) repeat protein
MIPVFRLRIFGFWAAFLLILEPAFGQRGGSTTAPGGNNPPVSSPSPGTGAPTRTPNTGQNPNTTSPEATGPAIPIYLSGRVMLDDGGPPPNHVAIQRVCGATVRTEGHTDSQGYFNVQLGSTFSDTLQDASTSSLGDRNDPFASSSLAGTRGVPIGERQLLGCELRAQAAGYQSQSVILTNRRSLDNPNIGTILLHRLGASEGTTVSATTLAAPKDARKAYEQALALGRKNKLEEAAAQLEKAATIYPRYALAWCELGRVQAIQGRTEDARKSFGQSIAADPKYVLPYVEISRLELRAGKWQELAETSEKATKLDPFNYPDAFFWNAVANYNLHNVAAAEESARHAQKLDSRHQIPQLSQLMALILQQRNDYSAAAEQMRDYLKFAPQAQDAPAARAQLEQLEKLAKTTPSETPQQQQ